ITSYGVQVANTHTGSGTNVGGYFTASGGSNNYGLLVDAGNVGIGTTAPKGTFHIGSTGTDYEIVNQSAVTNLIANSSFETGTSSWTASNVTLTQTTAQALYGANSMSVTASNNSDNFASQNVTVSTNTTYIVSAWMYTTGSQAGAFGSRGLYVSQTGDQTDITTLPVGVWTRQSLTFASGANTTLGLRLYSGVNGGTTMYYDGIQVEAASSVSPYADGSFGPGYTWSGTVHNSSSTRIAGANFDYYTLNSASGIGAASRGTGPTLRIEQDSTGDVAQAWSAGTQVLQITQGGKVVISPVVATSGSPTLETLTGPAHTTLAASTEATDVNWNLARTVQFATGALTTQRAVQIQAPTYGFVGASTITNATTVGISGIPVAGTNATLTTAAALRIAAGAGAATTTNAYGLYVDAPTGATNNYAATFATGNVGIGTTSPGGTLAVLSTNATGTTTSAATSLAANSLTSGTGLYVASSTLTSGKAIDVQVSGTAAAASQTALNIATAGANATSSITSYGVQVANTHTGSGTNVGGYFTASGGSNNYGLIVNAGNVGIGTTAPTTNLDVRSSGVTTASTISAANSDATRYLTLFSGQGTQGTAIVWDTTQALRLGAGSPVDASSTFSEYMRITSAGTVVIGTGALATNATDGFLNIPSSAGAPTGTPTTTTNAPTEYDTTNNKLCVYNTAWKCTGALTDYAEWTPAKGTETGDIVSVTAEKNPVADPTAPFMLGKSQGTYEAAMVGVVSEYAEKANVASGYKLSDDYHPVALAGRVPINVTNENGPIKAGDYLTSSSTPGKSMKATAAGRVIGIALESFDGSDGKIVAFIQNFYYNPTSGQNLQGNNNQFDTLVVTGLAKVDSLEVAGSTRLNGSLTVNKDAKVLGMLTAKDLIVTGSLTLKGDLKVATDTANSVTIKAGEDKVTVTFSKAKSSTPVVAATPLGELKDTAFWIAEKTKEGFVIQLNKAVAADTSFDWIAVEKEE
ncbi:hypothetical protein HY065_02750, partial [Candidatus Berkelbacteria bacterium]|nr:hypothetical protein [Candidatus Berkelbacteria bacterium]